MFKAVTALELSGYRNMTFTHLLTHTAFKDKDTDT